MTISSNISLLPFNTFHLDAHARMLIEYDSVEELRAVLREHHGERMLHIGQGSNLLFVRDFDGIVLRSRMARARALGENGDEVFIEAQNGLILDSLIAQLCDMGLIGLENLSYIPGTVGASAVQNVGAYGVEAKDVIVEVHTVSVTDGEERIFSNEECRFGYRDSIFKNELKNKYIVTSVVYRLLKRGDFHLDYGNLRQALQGAPSAMRVREAVIAIRQQKLPEVAKLGSAGSFFKNPVVSPAQFAVLAQQYPDIPHFDAEGGVKVPAAWLIDRLGWKGKTKGGAQVYPKQPLVIVNMGAASAADIVDLAQQIMDSVIERFGIHLHPEVNYIE
ncbi:MAG: UDP-N-acetylmuramate dehydrogenase [Paludibacteraceae bacterium]|nr:UDP-N-acetylmuramate dehydrogenase [Paludibacteraceae bacterium]